LESEINNLVDKLEADNVKGNLKMFTDGLFDSDIDTDYDVDFNFGEPVKKDEPEITYF
jgi:hypothetical protein